MKKKYSGRHKKHFAVFTYAGEIRFGPPYFNLEIDGLKISYRKFSDSPIWSKDERLLAIQEWNSINESTGPIMRICVFDLENRREYTEESTRGFTHPKYFKDNLLIYEARIRSKGCEVTKTIELNLETIDSWKDTVFSTK